MVIRTASAFKTDIQIISSKNWNIFKKLFFHSTTSLRMSKDILIAGSFEKNIIKSNKIQNVNKKKIILKVKHTV